MAPQPKPFHFGWDDLTDEERQRLIDEHNPEATDPREVWQRLSPDERQRFLADCAQARITAAPDAVQLAATPLGRRPAHRAQHVFYSKQLGLCVQRKGKFREKRRGGKRIGWERRGEVASIHDGLPDDLEDMIVEST